MDMSELERLEQQQRITRLSEAIRIGARIRPQCTTGLFFDGKRSCALGAAYEAVYGRPAPAMGDMRVELAAAGIIWPVPNMNIIGWNDHDKLTREQIADRLEAEGY